MGLVDLVKNFIIELLNRYDILNVAFFDTFLNRALSEETMFSLVSAISRAICSKDLGCSEELRNDTSFVCKLSILDIKALLTLDY